MWKIKGVNMEIKSSDGIDIHVLPESAKCFASEDHISPVSLNECPCGYDICCPETCTNYSEADVSDRIKVLIKSAGQPVRIAEIENSLKSFKEVVGGHLESCTVAKGVVIICNEEGRRMGLPYNCEITLPDSDIKVDFCGDIFIAGTAGDCFTALPDWLTPERWNSWQT